MRLLPLFPLFAILRRRISVWGLGIVALQLARTFKSDCFWLHFRMFFYRVARVCVIVVCHPRENAGYSGFGCAAIVSRNVFTLLLSMMAVPVSTNVGIGAVGAVRQSLNSCTELWCKSSENLIA